MSATSKNQTRKKVRRYVELLDTAKKCYREADGLLQDLLQELEVGEAVEVDVGKSYAIVDNFADKNKVYKATGVSRFDLAPVA